jgi:hypothetical protein
VDEETLKKNPVGSYFFKIATRSPTPPPAAAALF